LQRSKGKGRTPPFLGTKRQEWRGFRRARTMDSLFSTVNGCDFCSSFIPELFL